MSLITGGSANLVPCLTNANTSQTVFGSGGGGGAGPNLAVSSLTLPPYQGPQTGSITFSGGMAITELTASPNYPEYFFDPQKPTSGAYDLVSTFASSITTFNIASPVAASATLNLAAGDNGNCMIFMNDPISTLALVANPVVIPGNLIVSSINGQAPGGGGSGPNLVISTLTVNDTGNITLDWNNGGGTLNFGFDATNTSSFILQQGIGVSGTKVAGPEGCIQVLEKDGGANQVFAPLQASGFEVCATAYPGGAFAGLYFSSIGSVLYSAVGQPLTIDAPSGVNISSLTVSSINGAVPASNITNQYLANSVSSIGSLPIYNSQVVRVGKLQTVQFEFVYASTSTGSVNGYIDMLASAMAPGNWLWQTAPSVVMNSLSVGSGGIAIGVNGQLSGDPGDLSQDFPIHFVFADSNIPQNVLCTMTGIAYN